MSLSRLESFDDLFRNQPKPNKPNLCRSYHDDNDNNNGNDNDDDDNSRANQTYAAVRRRAVLADPQEAGLPPKLPPRVLHLGNVSRTFHS